MSLYLQLWLAHPLRDKTFNSNGWIIYHALFPTMMFYTDELIEFKKISGMSKETLYIYILHLNN